MTTQKYLILTAIAITLFFPLSASAGGGWTMPLLQKSIDRPPGVQADLWKDALGELETGIDGHGMVVGEHILFKPAMSKMIPENKRRKMCDLLGSKPVPVDQFLMALAAWGHNAIDELLKRNPSKWWSPGSSGGPCACEWVKDRECCQRATTCAWQAGFCGCV